MEDENKVNWMIQDMNQDLKNKVVAEAKMDKMTVAEKMTQILSKRYAKTKFVTS